MRPAGVLLHSMLRLPCMQVMRMWPFRGMIRSSAARSQLQEGQLEAQHAFIFGSADDVMRATRMSNRLTGYVYLMDGQGRLRWQAAGPPQVLAAAAHAGPASVS